MAKSRRASDGFRPESATAAWHSGAQMRLGGSCGLLVPLL
eukprot:SAG11_NODE_38661_length_251_cov_0.921053_1_plen_39_part_10